MDTRSSGKQVATRITTVVAVGSLAVTGLGFVAVYQAPTVDAASTSYSADDDSSNVSDTGQEDSDQSPDARSTNSTVQTPGGEKSTPGTGVKSTVSPVGPSTGGSISSKSSGS